MTLTRYLILMSLGTAIAWAAWMTVVNVVNPFDTDGVGYFIFYASFSLALAGSFALVGLLFRTLLLKQELMFQKVAISFRQGIFFAILIDGFLILQSQRLLTWYNIAFLVIGLTIAEFFVISRKPIRHR